MFSLASWRLFKKSVVCARRVHRARRRLGPAPFVHPHVGASADTMSSPAAIGVGATGPDTVVVLDYGSQYTQLITRRVRELGVYSVLLPGDADMVRAADSIAPTARITSVRSPGRATRPHRQPPRVSRGAGAGAGENLDPPNQPPRPGYLKKMGTDRPRRAFLLTSRVPSSESRRLASRRITHP